MSGRGDAVMAVGAHTGDAQLSCGLLLARQAMEGRRVLILDLTAGERGGPRDMDTAEFRRRNVEAAAAFAGMLGGESLVLEIPDGELEYSRPLALRIADLMREHGVGSLLCHWKHSLHRDHVEAHRLCVDAAFYAALPSLTRPLPPAPIKRVLYAENWEDSEGFTPYAYFDVTGAFPLWKEAVRRLYLTEQSPWFAYLQYYEGLARMRGALIRTQYATAFGVDDHVRRVVLDTL